MMLMRCREVGGSDPARFRGFKARFANIVYPGTFGMSQFLLTRLTMGRRCFGDAYVESRVERRGGRVYFPDDCPVRRPTGLVSPKFRPKRVSKLTRTQIKRLRNDQPSWSSEEQSIASILI